MRNWMNACSNANWDNITWNFALFIPSVLPVLMTLYCLLIVGVILYNDLDAVIFLLCGIATGAPIYIVMCNVDKFAKFTLFKKIFQLTIGMQKLLMVVPPQEDWINCAYLRWGVERAISGRLHSSFLVAFFPCFQLYMFAYSYGFKGLLSHFVFIIGTRYFELTSQALK